MNKKILDLGLETSDMKTKSKVSSFKYYILTLPGAEETAQKEIENLGVKTTIIDKGVLTTTITREQATIIAYTTRTITGIHEEFKKEKIKDKKFTIRSTNAHNQQAIREQIIEELKKEGGELEYREPEIFLTVITIKEKTILCQDLYGDLSKRDYRIFTGKHGLIPATMNVLLDICEIRNKGTIIFPWCSDGIIAIETILKITRTSPHKYQKQKFVDNQEIVKEYDTKEEEIKAKIYILDKEFRNVNNARKNAILANVEKKAEFSRTAVEDLDLKFEDETVDIIITIPPQPSQHNDPTTQWNDFLKRGTQVLKKKGTIGVLMTRGIDKFTEIAEKKGLMKEKEIVVLQGAREVHAIMYKKK